MAGKSLKPGSGGFDPSENVNSNTLKRHPKMDLSRNDLLQLLSYLEGELQARDITIATLKAEKAKQLLYQAKYGRFGLGDPFTAMQRDSDNMKDNSFDESAIKCMYDNQLAQLENLIATQRKAQMKMREQMIASDKRYQKVCSELDDEKKKHAQDTAQGDDVTYMLEKERERLKQEVEFEKANVRKMEKDLKKTLASLEEERANSGKHKQVALMLIKERKKLVEKYVAEKQNAEELEKLLNDERTKAMNMAEGLVQESKKSLKMEATMERQLSEFDLEREQMKNKLLREENRNKDLQAQIESLKQQLENLPKQVGKSPKDSYHSVEIKSQITSPQVRLSSERTQAWSTPGTAVLNVSPSSTLSGKVVGDPNVIEREAGLSPRNSPSDLSVRKRDTRYASPQPHNTDRGGVQYHDNSLEARVAPVGAVSDRNVADPQTQSKLNVSMTGGQGAPTVVSGGGRITVQTGSPTPGSGPVSPRRVIAIGRGVPPPIPPNKPVLSVTSANTKPLTQKIVSSAAKENRVALTTSGSKPVHIPVSVVHTSTVSTTAGSRAAKREGSPSSIRKPAQLSASLPLPATSVPLDASTSLSNSDSFDFLGPEMADLQQLLVSMVTVSPHSTCIETTTTTAISACISTTSSLLLSSSLSTSLSTSSVPVVSSSLSPAGSNFVTENSKLSQSEYSDSNFLLTSLSSFSTLSGALPYSSPLYTSSKLYSSFDLKSSSTSLQTTTISSSMNVCKKEKSGATTKHRINQLSTAANKHQSEIKHGNEKVILSRDDRGLLPPTSSQASTDLWTKHQNGNKDLPFSPIHRYASSGNSEALRKLIIDLDADINLPMKDGTTPSHCAAENGQEECLKLLISRGGNINCIRDDQLTPVHCAAAQGHSQCLDLILTHGGQCHITDQSLWTPLHWAAANGHIECCKILLKRGAKRTALTSMNWTPCHIAVHYGHVDCLDLLLTFEGEKSDKLNVIKPEISQVVDRDGWTLAHLAASKDSSDCLSVILAHCDIDIFHADKLGRSVMDVSSVSAHHILLPYVSDVQFKRVPVEMICTGSTYHQQQPYVVGQVDISSNMDWSDVYKVVRDLCESYFSQIDRGLHSKKISRLDPENSSEDSHSSLGLTKDSIHSVEIGSHTFSSKTNCSSEFTAYEVLLNNNIHSIIVKLKGWKTIVGKEENASHQHVHLFQPCFQKPSTLGSLTLSYTIGTFDDHIKEDLKALWEKEKMLKMCLGLLNSRHGNICQFILSPVKGFGGDYSSLAFDLLMPVSTISNYVRLVEQYHSVIFYGPEGTRKKQLVKRLSHHLANKEEYSQAEVKVVPIYLHKDFSHSDFTQILKENGCLLPLNRSSNRLCILMFFHLEKVNFSQVFGSFLSHIDHRGKQHAFTLTCADNIQESFYLSDNFFLIATMDKPRSIGLDLSIQQRFRWVNFCVSVEPIRNLLARHLLRRLIHTYSGEIPSSDNLVYKAVEWLVCVWQRLNDGVSKLGLSDVVFGPEIFLPCPLEVKNCQSLYEWMAKLWNDVISTAVKSAIIKGKEGIGDNNGKVTSTALYVLLQRVVVPGCPLTGAEKDDYLKQFQGSNELDIPLNKSDKSPNPHVSHRFPVVHDVKHQADEDTMSSRPKHRNSIEGDGRFRFTQTVTANSHPKRRSLSETYLEQAERIEIPVVHHQGETSDFQPKVPKLEIRSPVLGLTVTLPSNQGMDSGINPLTSLANNNDAPARRSTFSSHSRIPLSISKRSRSSETIHRSQGQGRSSSFRPTSPFSFSLTTPTSSLFSFKFLDNNNKEDRTKKFRFDSARESQC